MTTVQILCQRLVDQLAIHNLWTTLRSCKVCVCNGGLGVGMEACRRYPFIPLGEERQCGAFRTQRSNGHTDQPSKETPIL